MIRARASRPGITRRCTNATWDVTDRSARLNASGARAVVGVGAGSLTKDPLNDAYTYRANLALGADSQGMLNPTLNTTLGGYSSSVTTPTAGSTFAQAGLYGTLKVADSAYAYAGVSAEARTGQTLYGGSVGYEWRFSRTGGQS